jgi:dihydroorotate dehydrogenase
MDAMSDRARNAVIHFLYKGVLKKFFFLQDPETVHDHMVRTGVFLGRHNITRIITRGLFGYQHDALHQTVCGIRFNNPIGLAAGFDKNAQLLDILPSVGFGYEEVGSITGEPCTGNAKPRLWRLKESGSLVVYYGLKNDGAEVLAHRLRRKQFRFPVGISIAKTNCEATCDLHVGVADYVKAYKAFTTIGDYFTINISCPNAFGGQPFTDPVSLEALLSEIDLLPKKKPVFIKFSPDLSKLEVDALLDVVARHKIDGFVISNLTKKRENDQIVDKDIPEKGGMSGKVVQALSDEMISYVYQKTQGKYVIIGVGGIFTAEDAYTKIKNGASLVQLITGMIFEGPQIISDINRGLVKLLQQDGYTNISQAIGAAHRKVNG